MLTSSQAKYDTDTMRQADLIANWGLLLTADHRPWIMGLSRLIFAGPHVSNLIPLRLLTAQGSGTAIDTLKQIYSMRMETLVVNSEFLGHFIEALAVCKHLGFKPPCIVLRSCAHHELTKSDFKVAAKHGVNAAEYISEVYFGDTQSIVVNGVKFLR
jgi:hypothetical protein